MQVVENATGYKCAISPATNDLNVVQIQKIYIAVLCIFTALHGMQTLSSNEKAVCLSVRQTRGL